MTRSRPVVLGLAAVGGLLALALVAILVVAGLRAIGVVGGPDTRFTRSLAILPEGSLRVSYIDWTGVRAEVGEGIGPDSDAGDVAEFLDRAFEADLVSTSGLWDTTATLAEVYGFSALDAQSEVLAQGSQGAVTATRLPDDASAEPIEDALAELGYVEPSGGAGAQQIWTGDETVLAQAGPSLPALLLHVLVTDEWVLTSDSAGLLDEAAGVLLDDADNALEGSLADLVDVVGDREPLAALVWPGDFVCEDLAMAQAATPDQQVADNLVEEAGGVGPLSSALIAAFPDGSVGALMGYEDADRARRDFDARLELARGDAVGKVGTFPERFTVDGGVEGSVVRLELEPVGDPVMSEITRGPVLFATC
ncbi:MAG: hypothetical protein Q8Q02_01875 [Nocardioides sp.]|nr:hypothetical protein [Nocardioides sp.]